MITLYGFGPAFGLPDASPFVLKTEIQLKMAGLAYRKQRAAPADAPKGKLPYIEDGREVIADSTFIRDHIERRYGADLDRGLNREQRALAWAVERMVEDHLYWTILHLRWIDDANFARGPAHFFDALPEDMRDTTRITRRERVRLHLEGHGIGRHGAQEVADLAGRSLGSLSDLLSERIFLMGREPCAADAAAFAMVASALVPLFDSEMTHIAAGHVNLVAYRDRLMQRYFPDYASAAIQKGSRSMEASGDPVRQQ